MNPLRRPGSQPTRILFIIDELREPGGAERALLKTIRLLPRDRFQPHLLTLRADPDPDLIRDVSCPVYIFPLARTYDLKALVVARRLIRLIRSLKPGIVQTFFETSDLWAGPIARLTGVPVVISSRRDMGILRSRKHRLAYRALGRIFDQTHAVSEVVRQEFIQKDRLRPSRVVTVYNGVTLDRIDSVSTSECTRVRHELNLGETSHIITALGHIRRVKGLDVLIRAVPAVQRRFPNAVFIIAGETHEAEHGRELSRLCAELGVTNRVRFLGGIPDPLPLLKASDVFCLPSRSEGLSNALLEAMACGLPAVATRVGGNPEVIDDGRNGYIVESEDANALAERLSDLLDNQQVRADMGRMARSTVEDRFSDEQMIARVVREYESLLRGRRGSASA